MNKSLYTPQTPYLLYISLETSTYLILNKFVIFSWETLLPGAFNRTISLDANVMLSPLQCNYYVTISRMTQTILTNKISGHEQLTQLNHVLKTAVFLSALV